MNTILDILLLGGVFFAVWKLYSAFGRRQGFEQPEKPNLMRQELQPPDALAAGAEKNKKDITLTQISKKLNEVLPEAQPLLQEIVKGDKSFSSRDFFKGARVAYKMIVEAFAKGDMEALKNLLRSNVAERFQAEIERRAHNNHQVSVEVQEITTAKIVRVLVPKNESEDAQITLQLESQQLSWTKDEEGRIIAGDPNTPRTMKDIWTFAKKLNSPNPNWFLVATGK